MPRFSVVIPCFNAADTITETLESLLAQTESDWEALVIDDGSTDDTRLIVASLAGIDLRFRLMKNSGVGPSAARNMALAEADGEIITFLDADDCWHPEKLERLDTVFDDETVDACFARVAAYHGGTSFHLTPKPDAALSVNDVLNDNPVYSMSNMAVRLESFLSSGGFNTEMVQNADAEWLIRLVGDGAHVIGLDEVLVGCKCAPGSLSSDLEGMAAGRAMALASAARYGVTSDARTEASYMRQQAARALRLGAPGLKTLRLGLSFCAASPSGWFSSPFSGARVLLGALLASVLPRSLRAALMSR